MPESVYVVVGRDMPAPDRLSELVDYLSNAKIIGEAIASGWDGSGARAWRGGNRLLEAMCRLRDPHHLGHRARVELIVCEAGVPAVVFEDFEPDTDDPDEIVGHVLLEFWHVDHDIIPSSELLRRLEDIFGAIHQRWYRL